MAGDNLICNHDNLKRHMIYNDVLSDWSEDFYWNYYDHCEGKLICNHGNLKVYVHGFEHFT